MVVLHLIDTLEVGGAQTRLLNDLRYIDKERFTHVVCSLAEDGAMAGRFREAGVEVVSLGLRRLWETRKFVELCRLVRQRRVNVIHSQLFLADQYSRMVAAVMGVKRLLTTVQSSVYEPNTGSLYSWKRHRVDRWTMRVSRVTLVAVSEFVKQSVVARLGVQPSRIHVVYNHVDVEWLNRVDLDHLDQLRTSLAVQPDEVILVVVARLNQGKGHRYVFEALQRLMHESLRIRLLIVGDGSMREELIGFAEQLGIRSRVQFLGERTDVRELLHISDIVVHPCLEGEGLPVAVLEAMGVGKPCVASNIGPLQEVIRNGETGALVPPRDSGTLASALVKLALDKHERVRLGEAARRTVERKFSTHVNVRLLEAIYDQLRFGTNGDAPTTS